MTPVQFLKEATRTHDMCWVGFARADDLKAAVATQSRVLQAIPVEEFLLEGTYYVIASKSPRFPGYHTYSDTAADGYRFPYHARYTEDGVTDPPPYPCVLYIPVPASLLYW